MDLMHFFDVSARHPQREVSAVEFSRRLVHCREYSAGGDLHYRWAWTQFLRSYQICSDCPPTWKKLDADALASLVLKFSDPERDPPGQEAARRIHERWRRSRDPVKKIRRRWQLKPYEKVRRVDRELYYREIKNFLRWMAKEHPLASEKILAPLSVSLRRSMKRSGQESGLVPFGQFNAGLDGLMTFFAACFQERVELAEFTMANWQVICSMAMSKWRPYELKTAAKVALEEILAMSRGRSLLKPPESRGGAGAAAAVLGPLDVLREEDAEEVATDFLRRLKRAYEQESVAEEVFEGVCGDVARLQKHRDLLLHLQKEFQEVVSDSKRLLFLLASLSSDDFGREQHAQYGIDEEAFLELVFMSPLHLTQRLVAFACSRANDSQSDFVTFKDMLHWLHEQETPPPSNKAGGEGVQLLEELLRASESCRKCGSRNTINVQLKTHAADEVFTFKVVCNDCYASF